MAAEMLKVEEKIEQDTVTFVLEGRLQTNTAPVLEAALQNKLEDAKKVVLDFTKVSYTSSVGLRILLETHNTMVEKAGCMVIKGVNESVYETFAVTGFTDIFNLE